MTINFWLDRPDWEQGRLTWETFVECTYLHALSIQRINSKTLTLKNLQDFLLIEFRQEGDNCIKAKRQRWQQIIYVYFAAQARKYPYTTYMYES